MGKIHHELRKKTKLGGTSIPKESWVAFLRNYEVVCSGTIISQKFILTAGECVLKPESAENKKCDRAVIPENCFYTPEELSIRLLGDGNLGKRIKIKRIKPHLNYNHKDRTNNIALVELEQPLECSPMTSPICLPHNIKALKLDNKLSIAGWGSHAMYGYYEYYHDDYQTLREGEMEKIETSKCNNSDATKPLHNQYLCAFAEDESACHGDIGGSGFARSGKNYYAIGIISHSNEARFRPSLPITFTNINHFAGWLRHFVRKFPEPWSK
ncbi:tryptase beta-2 [Trichonephila inaurata madagascariensis]|uniref:Tryptase beta-2 n=1 Tax=Trichonephila inaurata madagascariensis TaxID=2747483 RepID=A0A8X6YPD3_9ARAC|nr:tryptase beta-2 [Trichonephila inaurata madagascariensis]